MKEKEEWRQYLNTKYFFSNLGRAKGPNGILKPYPNTSGYLQVGIYINGHRDKMFLSVLVATCFVPNPNGFKYVHHKDENPRNNRADNLEWVQTPSHPERRSPAKKALNRERKSKAIAQINIKTGDIIQIWSREKLKLSPDFYWPYIRRCCNIPTGGRHRGYIWKYIAPYKQTSLFEL